MALQIVEWKASNTNGNRRTGQAQAKEYGTTWAAIVDVDASLGKVYNGVKADYISVTNTGKVTAFQVEK